MPGEEESVDVHGLRAIDVDDCVVHVAVDGGRVFGRVELRRSGHETFDSVSVGFAFRRGHAVEVDSRPDVVGVACLTTSLGRGIEVRRVTRAVWHGRNHGAREYNNNSDEGQKGVKHIEQSSESV